MAYIFFFYSTKNKNYELCLQKYTNKIAKEIAKLKKDKECVKMIKNGIFKTKLKVTVHV